MDGTSNTLARSVAIKSIGHLAADSQGAVWVATQDGVAKLAADGGTLFQSDLKTLGLASLAIIAVDAYDNSVWLTDSKTLVRLDAQGRKVATLDSPIAAVRQMRIGLDESVWLLGSKQLAHVGAAGAPLAIFDLHALITAEPKDFIVDDLGGLIWLAGEKELVQVDRVFKRFACLGTGSTLPIPPAPSLFNRDWEPCGSSARALWLPMESPDSSCARSIWQSLESAGLTHSSSIRPARPCG